jgi:hypothetical protein
VPAEAAAAAAAAADVVLVEAEAIDASRVVATLGSAVVAAVAGVVDTPVWGVAGVGRRLPAPIVDAIVAHVDADDDFWGREAEWLPLRLVAQLVGPSGRSPAAPSAVRAECEMAPELLRSSPM